MVRRCLSRITPDGARDKGRPGSIISCLSTASTGNVRFPDPAGLVRHGPYSAVVGSITDRT